MNTKKLLEPITPGEILREDFMNQLGQLRRSTRPPSSAGELGRRLGAKN